MRYLLKILLNLIFLGLLSPIHPQVQIFSMEDSLRFESAKHDTIKLRQYTHMMGTRIAAKAHNRLGYLKFTAGRFAEAEQDFKICHQLPVLMPERAESEFFIGRIKFQQKQLDSAIAFFQSALRISGNGVWAEGARYYLIKGLEQLEDTTVTGEMKKFIALYPNSVYTNEVEYRLIKQLYKKSGTGALQTMKQYLLKRPQSTYCKDVQYLMVKKHLETNNFEEAIQQAKLLVQKYPESNYAKDMKYQIGKYYYRAGKPELAKKYYLDMRQSSQPNTEAVEVSQFMYSEMFAYEKDYNRARAEFRKVKLVHPDSSAWTILSEYKQGVLYLEEGQQNHDTSLVDSALFQFENFITLHPTDKRVPLARLSLHRIYTGKEQWSRAIEQCDLIEQFDVSKITNVMTGYEEEQKTAQLKLKEQAHLIKASLYLNQMGSYKAALTEFNYIIEKTPFKKEGYIGKIETLLHMDDRDGAIAVVNEMIAAGGELAITAKEYELLLMHKGL